MAVAREGAAAQNTNVQMWARQRNTRTFSFIFRIKLALTLLTLFAPKPSSLEYASSAFKHKTEAVVKSELIFN